MSHSIQSTLLRAAIDVAKQTTAWIEQDPKWQKVKVYRTNDVGQRVMSRLYDQHTQQFIHTAYHEFILNAQTGDLYWGDDAAVVGVKGFFAGLSTPVYILGYIAWHVGKIAYEILTFGSEAYSALAQWNWDELKFGERVSNIAFSIGSIIRAPFYGLQMTFAGLKALFCPFEAREAFAEAEFELHHHIPYDKDLRKVVSLRPTAYERVWEVLSAEVCYLAYCFQKRGNLSDTKHFTLA